MARTRRTAHTRIAPEGVIADLRARLPRLVARIATSIQLEVDAYSGPALGGRRKLVEAAVRGGLCELLGRMAGRARPSAETDELFQRLGRGEAHDGQTLEAMRCAHDVATREVWDELHRVALSHGLPTSALGRLGDALFEQVGHLRDEAERGYQAALAELNTDLRLSRERLTRQLLDGADESVLENAAASARWLLPEQIIVVCAQRDDDAPLVDAELFAAAVLVAGCSPYALLLCDERARDELIEQARAVLGAESLTVSFPAAPDQVHMAARLAIRAHELTEQRVIPRSDLIDCAEHEELLWLHAEPILRERLASRLLAPLASERPHRRRVLAQTLLIRLEHRASAPTIASILGVHPQTVRHRLRQLDSMFADRLNDPELAFPMLLALKATLPSWLEPPSDQA